MGSLPMVRGEPMLHCAAIATAPVSLHWIFTTRPAVIAL